MSHSSMLPSPVQLSDRYLILLSGVLFGYAVFGKGFAYIGIPPLFVGELALLAGIAVLLKSGCLIASMTTVPGLLLAATMGWVVLRTIPFVGVYGIDALRDSVVVLYGGFAFAVITLLLEDGRRLNLIINYYDKFLNIFVPAIPIIYVISQYFPNYIPDLPGYGVPIIQIRSGGVTQHLAGAAVFALVGFRRVNLLWVILVAGSVMIASVSSRGAMLAFVVPVTFAAVVLGRFRQIASVLVIGLVLFAAAFLVESSFTEYHEARSTAERSISARQIINNVASIVGQGEEQTEDTKKWRLEWWHIIIEHTVYGSDFWGGRGFGLNLADADGFQDGDHPDLPPLRSPHNVYMTMLARAGVPGLVLWVLLMISWLLMLTRASFRALRFRRADWAGLFLFIGCYATAFNINAMFDVALEGPMSGIWFWCLIGFGIGSVMVFRCQSFEPSGQRMHET
jgi:hypothetical protein